MCNVLVVDDEAAIRGLITRWLEAAGYRTQAAVNAEQALHSLDAAPPAVVVSDIEMPGRDGFWLADEVRRRYPNTAIVMMTGCPDTGMAALSACARRCAPLRSRSSRCSAMRCAVFCPTPGRMRSESIS